jgi:hypothetical protein
VLASTSSRGMSGKSGTISRWRLSIAALLS